MHSAFLLLALIIALIAFGVSKTASTMTGGPRGGTIFGGFVLCGAVGTIYGFVVSLFVHEHHSAITANGAEIGIVVFALTAVLAKVIRGS